MSKIDELTKQLGGITATPNPPAIEAPSPKPERVRVPSPQPEPERSLVPSRAWTLNNPRFYFYCPIDVIELIEEVVRRTGRRKSQVIVDAIKRGLA